MRALRVNETKITLRNAFIVHLFALGGKKNQNIIKEPSFGASCRNLRCLLTFNLRKTYICVAPDYFHFSIFWVFPSRASPLSSALNFGKIKSKFCQLIVLVCCCTANQYSKITLVFSKMLKQCALYKS